VKYSGNRSVDAEIELDIENGVIHMDYTDSFYPGAWQNSNTRLVKEVYHEYNRCILFRLSDAIYCAFSTWILLLIILIKTILEKFFYKYWVKYDLQYKYQSILKLHFRTMHGMFETVISGKLNEKRLVIPIRSNIWMDYEIIGDYSTYITKVSLKRRFITKHTYYSSVKKQDGWEVIFEFNDIPLEGKCVLKHIGR